MASFTQMAFSVGELVTLPLFLIAAEGIVADFKPQVRRMAERRSTRRSETGWVGNRATKSCYFAFERLAGGLGEPGPAGGHLLPRNSTGADADLAIRRRL